MPRPPNIDRPIRLNITLPETVRAKLDLLLFSEAEGRVPHGAYRQFIMERISEFFSQLEAKANEHSRHSP